MLEVNNKPVETKDGGGLSMSRFIRPVAFLALAALTACSTQTRYHGKVNTFRNDYESEKGMKIKGKMQEVVVGHVKPGDVPAMDHLSANSQFEAAMGRRYSTTVPSCSPSNVCVVAYQPIPQSYEAIDREKVMTPAMIRFAVDLAKELIRAGGMYFAAGAIRPAQITNTLTNTQSQYQSQWQSMSQQQQQDVTNYINQHCTNPGSGVGQPPRTSYVPPVTPEIPVIPVTPDLGSGVGQAPRADTIMAAYQEWRQQAIFNGIAPAEITRTNVKEFQRSLEPKTRIG